MFAIDSRSLAAFRIGASLLILIDLACRAVDLAAFYTDDGLVPRLLRLDMLGYGDPLGFEHQWSLHLLNGESWSQALLMLCAAWFAFWLLIGYRTRLAAISTWILLLSLHNRNPLILDAGDSLLRAMLFWSLFLPLARSWSIDHWRTMPERSATSIASIASAALLLQLALMYVASAAFKLHPVWTSDWSAVYYALHGDTFVTPIGIALREHLHLMQGLTVGTVVLELCGPVLALIPWRNDWFRCVAIVAFTMFHIGLALTLTLGLFPWVCIVCWTLFVPTSVWDRFAKQGWLQTIGNRIQNIPRQSLAVRNHRPDLAAWFRRPELPHAGTSKLKQAIVGVLFLYVAVWNVREVMGPTWVERIMPHRLNGPAIALGLAQNWSMFAPIPRFEDGWIVMKGTLRDGTEVNLWSPEEPLTWQKPELVSRMFPNSRWRRYLENLPVDQFAYHRQFLADWLQQRWDRERSGGKDEKMVARVELIRMLETTPPPGDPIPAPEPVEICVRHY